MSDMTLDRAILSRFSPGFGGTRVPEWLKPLLDSGLGGVTLFSTNCPSIEETARLVAELRSYAPGLIISIDEEGGDVTRLFVREGSPFPTAAMLGRCDDLELTRGSYRALGDVLHGIGIDMSYAPVADIVEVGHNPIIGVRSFGSDPALVARHTAAAVLGFRDAGVAACPKHFPGHGGVEEDSHHDLPTLPGDLASLQASHLRPFAQAIDAGASAIMVGHIVVSAIDKKNPASCSPTIVRELLKRDMGFGGLVVTDALDMGALGGPRRIARSATRALAAGCDVLCFSGLSDQMKFVTSSLQAARDAVDSGLLDADELLRDAERVVHWERPVREAVGPADRAPLERFLPAIESTGDVSIHPSAVHLVEMSADPTIAAGYVAWGMHRALLHAGVRVTLETSDMTSSLAETETLVVVFRDAFRDARLLARLEKLRVRYPDAVFVDMGWPTWDFTPRNIVRTYGSSNLATELVARLWQQVSPSDALR